MMGKLCFKSLGDDVCIGCGPGKCKSVRVVDDVDLQKMLATKENTSWKQWLFVASVHEVAAITEYGEIESRLRAEGNLDDAEAVMEIKVDEVSHKEKLEALMEAM